MLSKLSAIFSNLTKKEFEESGILIYLIGAFARFNKEEVGKPILGVFLTF